MNGHPEQCFVAAVKAINTGPKAYAEQDNITQASISTTTARQITLTGASSYGVITNACFRARVCVGDVSRCGEPPKLEWAWKCEKVNIDLF